MNINPREAIRITVKTLLEAMIEDRGLNIPRDKLDFLATEFAHDDDGFLLNLENFMESFLYDYGDNYGLYDLYGEED